MSGGRPALRYFVTLKGNEHVIDLTERGDGWDVVFDGRKVEADLVRLGGESLHSLLLDGHSREMVLEHEGEITFVSLDGERIEARVQDEVSRALAAFGRARPTGSAEVTAPMPGVVIEVRVAPGDAVVVGQPVIVVEAMKMQNELAAETDGVVEAVLVGAGQAVDGGAVLVRLQPREVPA
jgi:biotin carboxyl carrier protein